MKRKLSELRVLFITHGFPPIDIGGAERQAFLQAKYLRGHGVKIDVISQRMGYRGNVSIYEGVKVTRLAKPPFKILGTLAYLFQLAFFILMKGRKYDLIHVHIASLHADLAVLMGRLIGVPVHIKVACGGPNGEVARFKSLAKITKFYGLKHAASVQAISDEIRDELLSIGVQSDRICRIPNGVELVVPKSHVLRNDDRVLTKSDGHLQDDEVVRFLYLGRIATYKGLQLLFQAWNARTQTPKSELWLVGPSALDSPLELKGLDPSIKYIGPTDTPFEFYFSTEVFVSPSSSEGMSNAMMEAMTAGMPIIATKVGAAQQLITQGIEGILVESGHSAQLTEALNWMIDNPQQRVTMGQRSTHKIQNYSIESIVERIFNQYNQILIRNFGQRGSAIEES